MLAHLCKAPLQYNRDKKTAATSAAPCNHRHQPRPAAPPSSRCHDDHAPASGRRGGGNNNNSSSIVSKTEETKSNNSRLPYSEKGLHESATIKRSKSYGEISIRSTDNNGQQDYESTRDDIQLRDEKRTSEKHKIESETQTTTISKDSYAINSKVRCSGVLQRMKRFRLKHVLETSGKDSSCPNLSYKGDQLAKPRRNTRDRVGSECAEPATKIDAADKTGVISQKSSASGVPGNLETNQMKDRNPRPDLINSVLERTVLHTELPHEDSTVNKSFQPAPSCSQTAVSPKSSPTITEKANTRSIKASVGHSNVRKATLQKKCASPFGYDIDNIATFLQTASRTQPANIPMVLTQNVVIRSTGGITKRNNFSVPMGNVVNAMYKTGAWVYVRTAHGSEGLLPYKACVPLGILPTNAKHSAPWELDNSFRDVDMTEYPFPSICNVVEVNSTTANDCGGEVKHKTAGGTSEVLYENLDFLSQLPPPSFDLDEVSCMDEGHSELVLVIKRPHPNKTDTQKLMEFSSTALTEKPPTPVSTETVQQSSDSADHVPSPPTPTATEQEVQVMVVCDYLAKGQDRITVKNGEMVSLLQRTSDDWLLVRTSSGMQGLIPTAYTTIGTQCFL